jgi:hypothetical protein
MANEIVPGVVGDFVLEVAAYADGTTPTTYTPVRGITNFTPPGVTKNLEDSSDFDSAGWGSQTATGLSFEMSGTVKRARPTLTEDPGQAILRAAGKGLAEDGYVHFRVFQDGASAGVRGVADASFTVGGGARTDLTMAEFTLAGVGELEDYSITVTP